MKELTDYMEETNIRILESDDRIKKSYDDVVESNEKMAEIREMLWASRIKLNEEKDYK